MILIISTCKEKLHELEFVNPIKKIVGEGIVKNYKNLTKEDLEKASKIIICGTSLKDDDFIKNLDKFSWIKNFDKPVLGICAGMQIISLIFGAKQKEKLEIGFFKENFEKDFLGLKGEKEVYHLHKNYVSLPSNFLKFTNSEIPQAIKHKSKEIYGVLFHPEVRNKKLILEFVNL